MLGDGNFKRFFLGVQVVAQDAERRLARCRTENPCHVFRERHGLNGLPELDAFFLEKLFDEGDDECFGVVARLGHDAAVGRVDKDLRAHHGRIVCLLARAHADKPQKRGPDRAVDRFGVIISFATGLTKLGFVKWLSAGFTSMLVGMDWLTAFLLLGFAYIYLHYIFATASGHVAAMYVPFAAVAIGAGAPPMMVAICFAIFSNTMWGITEYAGGPGPIYFGQGYFERVRFYKVNFILVA